MTPQSIATPKAHADAGAAHPLIQSARENQGRVAIRMAIAAISSVIMFAYLDPWISGGWLAAIVLIEIIGTYASEQVARGDLSFAHFDRGCVLVTSLVWVTQAWLLWRVGGDIPMLSAVISLLTMSLYGAIGARQDRLLMLMLMLPPLAMFIYLVLELLWRTADPVVGVAAALATIGSCATILLNGLAMYAANDALARANAALAESAEAARRANAAKDVFLANMSHEIRTPLNGVVGVADALLRTELDAGQHEMANLIQASGGTLERLLNDLLDLSKIEAEAFRLHIAPFDLRQTIETAAHLMRVRADDKGIAFYVDCSPATVGTYAGDAVRLRQIVSNLAGNAVKFTESGSVTISAHVEAGGPADVWLTVRVDDTGPGFDAETAARLFQRFEQANSQTAIRFGGTGLGLAICKSLGEAMGGTVSATSVPGEGSSFTVRIPLHRATPAADAAADAIEPAVTSGQRLRMLLAEDNALNQKIFALLLAPHGVDLVIACDGAEAVRQFREQPFDAVLMDMNMPGMDGLAATQAIRAFERETRQPRTPIAMLTANALPEHIHQAMDAGCDGHITKPATSGSLMTGIRNALAASRAARDAA